jgi:DNA-binding protein YbaB
MTDSASGLAAREAIASFSRQITALRANTEAARAAITNAVASASSADGAVTVSTDAAGVVSDVEFAKSARDRSRSDLAALVVRTSRQAQIRALRQAQRGVADAVGESSKAVSVLGRQLSTLEQAAPTADAGTPGSGEGEDEGGFTGRTRHGD